MPDHIDTEPLALYLWTGYTKVGFIKREAVAIMHDLVYCV